MRVFRITIWIYEFVVGFIVNVRKEEWLWGSAIFVLTALNYACRDSTPVTAVAQVKEYDWDKSEVGLILSCFYWGYMCTQVLSGFLSDRVGGDEVITLAGIGWGLTSLLYPFFADISNDKTTQLVILVIFRNIFAMLQAFHYPAMASVVARRVCLRNRSFLYTAIGAGTATGNIVSGSIGSIMVQYLGWRTVYYLFGVLSAVWALGTRIVLLRKKCLHPCQIQHAHADEATAVTKKEAWKRLVCHRAFWAMLFTNFCGGYSWHLVFSWIPTFFEESFPGEKGWVFNVLPWMCNLPTHFFSGYIADWLIANYSTRTVTRKYLQTVGSLVFASCMFLLGHTDCYSKVLALLCTTLFVDGIGSAGGYANVQDLAPTHGGTVYGIMNTLSSLPGFIGVYISGHILEALHDNWNAVFSLCGSVQITGYVVFLFFGSGHRIV